MNPAGETAVATGRRWVICGLLFCATAGSYLDRQALSVLAPALIREFAWKPESYAQVVFWFQVGYALAFLPVGWFFDRVGTRVGFVFVGALMSVVTAAHALAGSLMSFMLARGLLGLAGPGHMAGGVKVVAEVFGPAERALATGLFKCGSNAGAIVAPLLVPWVYLAWGWRAVFWLIAAGGLVWLVAWWRVFPVARADAPVAPRVPWRTLCRRRETWAYMNFKFMTDAVWHWYLAMLPLFLHQRFGLGLKEFGPTLVAVYVIAAGGSVGGGWLAGFLMRRGWSVTRARKSVMLLCCVATLPVVLVTQLENVWVVVILVGIAHAAHQGLTSNLFAAVSDLFPQGAVASVVGLGGTAGQLGAVLTTLGTTWLLATTGSVAGLFWVAGPIYLVAYFLFHLAVPVLRPVQLAAPTAREEAAH